MPAMFQIPAEMTTRVPCVTQPQVFLHRDMDIDTSEPAWVNATPDVRHARRQAQAIAHSRAAAACFSCPLLEQCRDWALAQRGRIYGVVGGLTPAQRSAYETPSPVVAERGPRGQVRDDVVADLTRTGATAAQIAQTLGCHPRTVERRRAGLRDGGRLYDPVNAPRPLSGAGSRSERPRPAAGALVISRVTAETAAIFDQLLDRSATRDEVVEALLGIVAADTAARFTPAGRRYSSEAARLRSGARRFLVNRIDIAVRRGRITADRTPDGVVVLALDPATAAAWRAHRKTPSPAAA